MAENLNEEQPSSATHSSEVGADSRPHPSTEDTVPIIRRRPGSNTRTGSSDENVGRTGGVSVIGTSPTLPTNASSPLDALWLEEITRTRAFLAIGTVLAVLVAAALLPLGGNPTIKLLLGGGLISCFGLYAWMYVILRTPERFQPWHITVTAFYTALIVYLGVLYWGVFSAAPAMIVMGIYFYARAHSRRGALLIYLTCAAAQATLAALIVLGIMNDPGLFPATSQQTTVELLVTQAVVQAIYACTYAIGRVSRTSTLDAIEQLQRAMRQVSDREALLQEARQDLDRALRAGGAGRYTEQVFGSYKLGAVIGRGAMGEVYEATHVDNGDHAAVKLLHPHILNNPDYVTRFMREAKAASSMQSRHAVRVLQTGDPADQQPFLVMERLRGHDLAHHLRKKRRLAMRQISDLATQVGDALDEAARKRIVHRDLKPQNLFLSERGPDKGVWKILDFGVSKLGDHSGTLTRGHVVGTPVYMAPEQARGATVDFRADLYALAAIVYRCATGRPPFNGKDVPAILYSVVYQMPPQPSGLATVPEALDLVLAIGMAKNPANRFESAAEFSKAVAAAINDEVDDWHRRRAEALLLEHNWGSTK